MTTPLQSRSKRTHDNILKAAMELLDTKSFEEMTITDIVQRAGCSVGAFYGRFKDKENLLHALDERYIDQQIAAGFAWIEKNSQREQNLSEVIEDLMQMLLMTLNLNLGLLRTLILRARLYPDPRFRAQEARLNAILPEIIKVLMTHHAEIRHPDPATAVQVGFLQAFIVLRETLAWSHIGQIIPISFDALATELAHNFYAYLVFENPVAVKK